MAEQLIQLKSGTDNVYPKIKSEILTVSGTVESLAAGAGTSLSIPFTYPSGFTILAAATVIIGGYGLVNVNISNLTTSAITLRVNNYRSSALSNFGITVKLLFLP